MKQTIRLNENQFNNLVKNVVNELVKKVLNEVKLTGKSGKTYSLHGKDDKNHPNVRSRNNANRVTAMSKRAKNAADDLSESNLNENSDLDSINSEFKHVKICEHPLKYGKYMVINLTYKSIPPYIGTLKQCYKAALSAEKNSEERQKLDVS